MKKNNDERLVQVFAGTLWQAELIKGLLDSNGIPCDIKDNTIGAVTSSYAGLDGDVVIIVNKEDEERAIETIKENRK
ncbi:MAG: DUF2007 domain-containing protein [Bacteroidales bacterium]|nr:DUF2007 domain-containing protein [Bacteroidales bacterium]